MKDIKLTDFFKTHPISTLVVIYFLTRFLFLKSLPIFNDEATYIDWGWRMINIKGQFFYSLAHYKPPLFMWVVGVLRKFISDPLVAGRLVSIFAGLLSLSGIYKLAELLYNRRVATLSAILYIITPLFLFYDRQALMESSITTCGIWSFYIFLKLINSQNYKYAALLGLTLGLGYLVKTNAILFAIPLCIIYVLEIRKKYKQNEKVSINAIIVIASLLITMSPLFLNSTFWETLGKNKDYIFTFSELINFPFSSWLQNLKNFTTITLLYLNPLLILLALTSIYKNIKDKKINLLYATIYLFTGWIFIIILSRSVIPRHVVSFLPLILVFASDSILQLYNKTKFWTLVFLLVITISFATLSILLTTSPIKYFTTLNRISRFSLKTEYVTYWSSGYGVNEVVDYLIKETNKNPAIIGVRPDTGNPENAIIAYFQDSKKTIPTYLDARMFQDFSKYDCINSKIPVYFISRDNQLAGLGKHLEEIKKVYKPEGEHYIGIYKVKTDCTGGKTLNLF